jgi:hypothetical protein
MLHIVSVSGALVGNLSHLMSERKRGTEHLITSEEAKQRFLLTEAGLLLTSGQLDREERDSYMFTILLGRKGLPRGFRGQQAIQVKVKEEVTVLLFSDNSSWYYIHLNSLFIWKFVLFLVIASLPFILFYVLCRLMTKQETDNYVYISSF